MISHSFPGKAGSYGNYRRSYDDDNSDDDDDNSDDDDEDSDDDSEGKLAYPLDPIVRTDLKEETLVPFFCLSVA